ncbi:imidazolonepropionase [Brachybacterium sp. YJGR34]|uniref:imidazolonepropionase n=1 Tax=Brachybacterium sp. YJGR34 TaxID=2059911 RepID=UPI000E0B876A|nr:imidazolonepropionase [Brachybacterium sp. YJGR34]
MTSTLLTGLSELWTLDPALDDPGRPGDIAEGQVLRDAALVIEDGVIAWTGPAAAAPSADRAEDLGGRAVLPGWVDSHSHLIFDGDRAAEFEARMAGQPYAAGGIGVTTEATRAASEERLRDLTRARIAEARRGGTTCLETKTGYGLSVEEELRGARLASALVAEGELDEATFLGAHLVPHEYTGRAEEYVDLVTGPMLAAVAPHVRWIDVFCEEGAFDPEQSERVLCAGAEAGLGLRVHGHQLGRSGGVALAVELGAASVDHLNHLDAADLEQLAASDTVATVLPACDLSTRAPLAPARELLDAGARLAIASNANPGTSWTSSVSFCVTTAVLQMHLSLGEAVRAATRGGALALRREDVGHLAVGARADLHVLDAPAAIHLAYRPGMPLTHQVWRAGIRQR